MNENYAHPGLTPGDEEGIVRGMYPLRKSSMQTGTAKGQAKARVQLLGSGTILREALAGAELLETDWSVAADVWSVTSFTELRRDGRLPWLRPDAKSQVTIRYLNGKPESIDTVVLSTQHSPGMTHKQIEEAVIEQIIKPVLPKAMIKGNINYLVNPTGAFEIGGPKGDCGLTGRKIIVDTYGGSAPHGGGAFSGKDPSKVDRSAAYAARYVAKNVVAAGLAARCQVQVSYAIGVAKPTSVMVTTFGTGKISDEKLSALVSEHFDLRPKGIIQMLDLLKPIYEKTASYGHFGRDEAEFSWERTDKAQALAAAAK